MILQVEGIGGSGGSKEKLEIEIEMKTCTLLIPGQILGTSLPEYTVFQHNMGGAESSEA